MNELKNGIYIAYKPIFESSNAFLTRIKRLLCVKKAGFSGTLDPFAKGVLLIAVGSYTRLFSHLRLSPKRYRATLWLGARSRSLDIENIESVRVIPPFEEDKIREVLDSLHGDIPYTPPIFSAKKINGQRAYKLARERQEVLLKPEVMRVYSLTLLAYWHPFVSFDVSVSKGGYIRSLGEKIAHSLGVDGALSSLERTSEGLASFENPTLFREDSSLQNIKEKIQIQALDVSKLLEYPLLKLPHLKDCFMKGQKIRKSDLNLKKDGCFIVDFEDFFSIIQAEETDVKYLLNRIKKC